jgi:DNA-binding beta-propeller fold protein YncE
VDPARRPRTFVLLAAALLVAVLPAAPALARGGPPTSSGSNVPGGGPAGATRGAAHEVWVLDQGTDLVHVHDSRADLAEIATIDVGAQALRAAGFALAAGLTNVVPHMIEFDSRHRYAFVAATAGGVTIVIDARTKAVVAVLPTGPASHMAAVTPDDTAVWVSVIGSADPATQALVEIPLDLDAPEPRFAIGRRVVVRDVLEPVAADRGWEFPGYQPVCHQYSPDSREAWVTLGPQWNRGGLFVLDLETATVTAAWDPAVVKANCGLAVNREGTRVVANWSGAVVGPGQDTTGEWYLFDARTKQLLRTESARGFDAHGVRFTPDGRHLWAVNRISDDGLIIDGRSFRVVAELDRVADTPDILDFSPDGAVVYVTQRGPSPRSGGVHAASGQQPGVAVIDTATRRTVTVLEPPEVVSADGIVVNDVHGIAVRPVGPASPGRSGAALVRRPAVVPAQLRGVDRSFGCHVAS